MALDLQSIKQRFEKANQGHVFAFYDTLDQEQQQSLLKQLNDIDVDSVNDLYKRAITGSTSQGAADIQPLPKDAFDSVLSAPSDKKSTWWNKGIELIGQNKVAVLLLAGGQGTRLGSSDPKGCYDIGLPSKKSLFQLQAERIIRLQELAQGKAQGKKVIITWYIMTSGPTRSATEAFFVRNNYFGLNSNDVIFFNQGVLPCLTNEGKIILEDKSKVAVAPDGNGGIYPALRKEGIINHMVKRGVEYIHSYCVDNCLVRVADPAFIGYSVLNNAECGAKVVPKAHPNEAVGVICVKDNKFSVVEYSEITNEMAERIDDNGNLVFGAGNICNHFYSIGFLQRMKEIEDKLEYHIARKKIKFIDLKTGEKVSPSKPNGMKLEAFVFDVFPFTSSFSVLEVDRKEEFSPLKNAPGSGSDCPETSRQDIISQHVRFVEAAGGKVEGDVNAIDFEISPLVTYAGEGLEIVNGKVLKPAYINDLEKLKSL
ncbi:UDP-N-acetylglucosamine diphosphorylase [Neoconidiobolus thromboides FSU 785]|nr:UDP-N-acetylglucosamine diphosphorylase [Neoconidiobolus thromboides FSU 785]